MGKAWEANALAIEWGYKGHVDWHKRFYICPKCGEPIYECNWGKSEFIDFLCPICEYREE